MLITFELLLSITQPISSTKIKKNKQRKVKNKRKYNKLVLNNFIYLLNKNQIGLNPKQNQQQKTQQTKRRMKSNVIHLIWLGQTVCVIFLYYNFFTNTTVTCNSTISKLTKTPITYIRNKYIYIYHYQKLENFLSTT